MRVVCRAASRRTRPCRVRDIQERREGVGGECQVGGARLERRLRGRAKLIVDLDAEGDYMRHRALLAVVL